jgi:hypothetical protein
MTRALASGNHRRGARRTAAILVAAMTAALAGCAGPQVGGERGSGKDAPRLIDDFESVSEWTAHPADGVQMRLGADAGWEGSALRIDYSFTGGGYAIARRELDLELPENWAIDFRLRGRGGTNHLEFKLIDETGENVWWFVRRDLEFPQEWKRFTTKKRQVEFAWGPASGGEIHRVSAIEFAVTAGSGGSGTVWIDDLTIRTLPIAVGPLPEPVAFASSSADTPAPAPAALAVDGDLTTAWRPAPADPRPWLALDLGASREYGGLVVDWREAEAWSDYTVEISDDRETWREARRVHGGNGGRDPHFLPETESRYLRIIWAGQEAAELDRAKAAVAELSLRPLAWSADREAFFSALAADAPRGTYPRAMLGEQSYWTLVGTDGGACQGLLDEDGRLEAGPGAFSLEPFLFSDGELATWSDAPSTPALADGFLPIPSVTRRFDDLELRVEAFATGSPESPTIVARYQVANLGPEACAATLFLALRPFQVNPPSQRLNLHGGTARIRRIEGDPVLARVEPGGSVRCLRPAAAFGAVAFDGGELVDDFLRHGELPPAIRIDDPFEAASGAWAHPLEIAPGDTVEVAIVLATPPGGDPLADASLGLPEPGDGEGAAGSWVQQRRQSALDEWRAALGRVVLRGPAAATPVLETLRAQLAWILVNRSGPAIRPGARSYRRSWIRDGALTSTALLRMGHGEAARAFLEWYAPYQYASGKVPCVVDDRGADPVPEHDSSGELLYLIAEVFRFQGDRDFLRRLWPRVDSAADWLDALRHQRLGEEWQTEDGRPFYGILPPSISHEGYSAKPMHSYWDDFFAYRAFEDVVFVARELGQEEEAERLDEIRREFRRDLAASVAAAADFQGIDWVPGCADLGDFDPTSTTIAFSPTGAAEILPHEMLEQTFERYWEFFCERRDGDSWTVLTPYEVRIIGSFVRLGWRDRAQALIDFFLDLRRPPGWRQWPEVLRRDLREAGFLGDLPHGWVASDWIRSILDLFAFRSTDDSKLVIAAGIPAAWLVPGEPLLVRGLRTIWGPLDYALATDGESVELRIEGTLRVPPGGIVVDPPLPANVHTVTINGISRNHDSREPALVRELPAVIRFAP